MGDERIIVEGKETVVRRRGADWSFHLPRGRRIDLDQENKLVTLGMPHDGTLFSLEGVEETDDEVIVRLGAVEGSFGTGVGPTVGPIRGYPLPEIQEEIERLRGRWKNAGLSEADFNAWAKDELGQDESHEDHLYEIRKKLREDGS